MPTPLGVDNIKILDFLEDEITGNTDSQKSFINSAGINAASSIGEAADIFLKKYEKAGKPNADKRQLYAKQLLKLIQV